MKNSAYLLAAAALSLPVFAASPDLQAAVDLMKQSHADECQKQKIKVQLLAAHQAHDQDKLRALEPQLNQINQRLKPAEDKLNALKANIKKNAEDLSALETASLQLADCE